ncbi:hypothetical protein V498_10023 [Pseudogymnoascus sp. VKM F-4517 (FW-2822)]|nr:hypothetical protein V498_10023 [Pseudogymnoascus sp. VKM F-4517 (FW-2822)]
MTASSGAGGWYTNLKKSRAESDVASRQAAISGPVMWRTPKERSPGRLAGVVYTPPPAAPAAATAAAEEDGGREDPRGGGVMAA